ncbi:MAG: mandelate racemase/muconate lactonizing enzyme family protein [Parvibaculaceae bacterium]
MEVLTKPAPPQEAVRAGRPLVIKAIHAIPVALPLSKPVKMSGVTIGHAYNLVVRVETLGGDVGWGEAASAPTMTGETLSGMVAAVEGVLAPAIVGEDARFLPVLVGKMQRAIYANTGPRAAIEMALLDLAGRANRISFADLLGGAQRKSVSPMWLIGNATAADDLAEAQAKYREGFRFFKLKIGAKTTDDDIQTTLVLDKVLPSDSILCADANMGLTRDNARRYLDGIAGSRVLYVEQPLPHADLEGLAMLASATRIPICSDEGIHSIADIEANSRHGARGVSLKFIKLGGVTDMMRAVQMCDRLGMAVNVAGKVAESGIGSAANIQFSSAIREANWGVSLTHIYLEADIVRTRLSIVDGCIAVPSGAGLGVEVMEDRLRAVTMKNWSAV